MATPHIYRPKPRRPFEAHSLALQQPPSPSLTPSYEFLETPSRTHSVLNLTSSTLGGIYEANGHDDFEPETPTTPWETGDESLQRKRSSTIQRRHSLAGARPSRSATIASRIFRSILLFGLGVLYGLLVKHLHDDRHLAPLQVESIIKPSHDWRYLVFWGIAGVGLGSLLPLVDKLWDEKIRSPGNSTSTPSEEAIDASDSQIVLGEDWILAVRSVGAFVGIAFAIRKLPWASDMQASLTLALVNPVLWYIIDRSKPGLAFSAAIGATGSAILLASNSDLMPSPAAAVKNSTVSHHPIDYSEAGSENLVTRGNLEAGIWISSVLFCSCVCFGNIGRRLALNSDMRKTSFISEQPRRKSMGRVQAARQAQ
ncbi:fd53aab5-d329-4d2b-844c-42ff699ca169 [Sclerotinia trifoliorum]|uniref:Fd53aab5-d329-4d2b-844c-42ff699ca169 n=1 Tax=Sclerotinia trifoliorum TaxID=28548 RepID=A0A8H2ZLV3_9HELO|nr:fd53aab5-d329-4d2b-844c-42ff699ca169 [Sclerotinia trifoliorum]